VRYAERLVFASSEEAARRALEVYGGLRERGEAHARPFTFVVIEGDAPPRPLI